MRKKLVIFWVTDFKTIFNYSIPLQVELIVFAVAIKSNATDVDIAKIFNGDVQSTTVDTVTLNNIWIASFLKLVPYESPTSPINSVWKKCVKFLNCHLDSVQIEISFAPLSNDISSWSYVLYRQLNKLN